MELRLKLKYYKRKNWDDAISHQERETFLSLPAPQRKIVREVILAFKLAYPNN
jgi:hypothetical protein